MNKKGSVFTYALVFECGIRVNMTYALPLLTHDPLGRRYSRFPVTGRQLEVLAYYRRYLTTYHLSPVVREVCQHFGFASPQGGARHIQALVRKGTIIPVLGVGGRHRGYQLTEAGRQATAHLNLEPLPPLTKQQARRQLARWAQIASDGV